MVSPPLSPEYKTVIALTQNTTSAASTDRQIMSDFLFIRYSSFASCITCRVFVYATTYNKLRDYLRQVTSPQLTKIHINLFNVKNTSNQCSIWKLFSGPKDNFFDLSDNFIAKKENKSIVIEFLLTVCDILRHALIKRLPVRVNDIVT